MSKKRPFFKSRTGWANRSDDLWEASHYPEPPFVIPVRVVDARELTPEKAVEKVLQYLYYRGTMCEALVSVAAGKSNMTATITNGKVRVRKIKEAKR